MKALPRQQKPISRRRLIRHARVIEGVLCLFVTAGILVSLGCNPQSRWGSIVTDPRLPRQGDEVAVTLDAGDKMHLERIRYQINETEGEATSVPVTIKVDTCQDVWGWSPPGNYYPTKLDISWTRHYDDGEVITHRAERDLTVCKVERKNPERKYALYLAPDWDIRGSNMFAYSADKFEQTFSSAELVHRDSDWDDFYFHRDGLGPNKANSVDLLILFGHGSPHWYRYDNTFDDPHSMSVFWMRFGGLAHCGSDAIGELEYIVFISCSTLSIDDYEIEVADPVTHEMQIPSVFDVWFGYNLERPFSGLHMALGFRNIVAGTQVFGAFSQMESLCEGFARRMDDRYAVREAWFDAVGEAFSPVRGGLNMPAVIYLKAYENNPIHFTRDDYIFGNSEYIPVIEYWE